MKKICIFNNDGFSVLHFRKRLIKDLLSSGHNVTVLIPPSRYDKELTSLGVKVEHIELERFISPISDLLLLFRLYRFLKSHSFDLIHNMTIKPNIYGTMVAKFVGISRIVCLVPGAGYIFSEVKNTVDNITRNVLIKLYAFAMKYADKVWFQNGEDKEDFVRYNIIKAEQGVVIVSSGVDTKKFHVDNLDQDKMQEWKQRLDIKKEERTIMMVTARIIKSKGIYEFLEAARYFRERYPVTKFILIAPTDDESDVYLDRELSAASQLDNFTHCSSFIDDIEHVISLSDVMVLPSYYREGVPRALLEGLALGKPIVTTDHVGCRETVIHERNGFLVRPKDSVDLCVQLEKLITSDQLIDSFGYESRKLAISKFNDKELSRRVLKHLYLVDGC